jgi:hypothetical protein
MTSPATQAPPAPLSPWPSARLTRWPISPTWAPPALPPKPAGLLAYQKTVGTIQALFQNTASLSPTLARLLDYCFQQGGHENNANLRDRAFFSSCLAHDLICFCGDRDQPLLSNLPLNPSLYTALPQLEASHLDLYRVTSRSWLGRATFASLLRLDPASQTLSGGVRPIVGPKRGALVLGRLCPISRSLLLDAPLLPLPEPIAAATQAHLALQYAAHQALHPTLSLSSFLKVAGYHLYEHAAALLLLRDLSDLLSPLSLSLRPRLIEWSTRGHQRSFRDAPLCDLPHARLLDASPDGSSRMLSLPLSRSPRIHTTLRDALLSQDPSSLSLIAFIDPGQDPLVASIQALLPPSCSPTITDLDPNATYRALRHTIRLKPSDYAS